MKVIKRSIMIILSAVIIATMSTAPCSAADNAFKTVYEDALYGGLAGALVGGALMAFTKKPSKHFDYIIYGAAGGVLVGAAYGMFSTTKSMAEIDNGKVKFAFPTIIPEFQEVNSKGQTAYLVKAELIRGKF
jgi:hypothetical protein